MTPAACALLAFTSLNMARVAAYAPQIVRIYRDKNGASAVSIVTWTLFALTHLATIAYALLTAGDLIMASIFSLNATCCIAIVVLTTWKRIRHRQHNTSPRRTRPRCSAPGAGIRSSAA